MFLPPVPLPRISRWQLHHLVHPLILAGLTLFVFREGSTHEFTNWDDWKYIVENPLIRGFSLDRVWTAFTRFHVFNYNPLHLVSYMVDYEIWGLQAGGFFLTSLALHVATGFIFYFLALNWLRSGTAALLVAALFLVHPTRVESVAWLSERKDVLSGFFGAAALLAYAKHLERIPGDGGPSRRWILPVIVWLLFLFALLSKSQLVTLPLVLVAMDLCRRRPLRAAILSKGPLFALSAVFSLLTLWAHAGEGSQGISFPESLLVPLAALPRYLLQIVWPTALSPYHDFSPRDFHSPAWVGAGLALLALLALTAWRSLRGDRVWFFAVVWFLAFLAPVIGIVRINILLADRYLYLSILGPLLALASTALAADRARRPMAIAAAVAVSAFAWQTAGYLPVFHDTESLWARVLEVCPGSSMAHSNLGACFRMQGRGAEAALHYDADLAERPYFEESFLGRAIIHAAAGEKEDARRLYETLLEKRSQSVTARIEYADFLDRAGEAEKALEVLLGLDAARANAVYHCKLFDVYRKLKRPLDALEAAHRAASIDPYDPLVQSRLKSAMEPDAGAGGSARP